VVPCALSNFLFRKNHRAKRYQFIWIHATDASKCSFSIDFFLLAKKSRPFFFFFDLHVRRGGQTTEERKARQGFLFFLSEHEKAKNNNNNNNNNSFFSLFFFSLSSVESRGKRPAQKKAQKGDALHCRYTRAFK